MIASGWMRSSWARNSVLFLIFSGCVTGMPASFAVSLTGGTTTCMPRPAGLSGWDTTSSTLWPARSTAFSVGTANEGVPQKTSFIARLPLAGFLHLANFAKDEVALEGAHAADEENAVEVIDF